MNHPLHLAVAKAIEKQINSRGELLRDPACGGNQQLPLFVDKPKSRVTRMCCVDILVISSWQVKVIVEIEESGFLPTKICGKFLQSALANYFIHESRPEIEIPYADKVFFVQVLDKSKFFKEGSKKEAQANLIAEKINKLPSLNNSRIIEYRLYTVLGENDKTKLKSIGEDVSKFLAY